MSARVKIGSSYYKKGFFNQTRNMNWLPIMEDHSNIPIEIHCTGPNFESFVSAVIKYKGKNGQGSWINQSHMARIYAKPARTLVEWFKENITEGDELIFTHIDDTTYSLTPGRVSNTSVPQTLSRNREHEGTSSKWDKEDDWFWEGNIQTKIAEYLDSQKYVDIKTVDTQTKEKGSDITAYKRSTLWVIEVKGYPSDKYTQDTERYKKGTPKKTRPATQSRHWFSEALFSILLTKSEDPSVEVGLGFPRNETYIKFLNRMSYVRGKLGINVFLVNENGKVQQYHPLQHIKEH